MFRIKICGVTSKADALAAADAGADAIGLNFYRGSRRFIDPSQAKSIAAALPTGTLAVGVFVNAEPSDVRRIAHEVGLDAVQLHGEEGPEVLGQLAGMTTIKAFRIQGTDLAPVQQYLDVCGDCRPQMILLDAYQEGAHGGTGVRLQWSDLKTAQSGMAHLPFILAGGLSAGNVADAIRLSRPAAVDTASGVESSPGVKDAVKVRAFVAAARNAFEREA